MALSLLIAVLDFVASLETGSHLPHSLLVLHSALLSQRLCDFRLVLS